MKGHGQANLSAVHLTYTRTFPSSSENVFGACPPGLQPAEIPEPALQSEWGVGYALPNVSEFALAQAC